MTGDPLAALLVREGVLPSARVDEAIARQGAVGGTLDTALLELGLVDEKRLLDLLPRAYNARAARSDELAAIDKSVLGIFPRRLAEKHGVVPLDVNGRRLTVALAGPPDLSLLDEIGFMLSVYVKPAVTTQARIYWSLAAHYGIALPQRIEAILQRATARAESWSVPASRAQPRPPSAPSTPAPSPPAPPGTATSTPAVAATPETMSPAAREAWAVVQAAAMDRSVESKPKLEIVDGGTLEAIAAANEVHAQNAVDETQSQRRRQRVLWTVDDAIAELALAEDRDAMLDVTLRFAYRRLSTVAVFVTTKNGFVGWDVIDPLLERKDIAAFTLPLKGAHALAQVRDMQSPFLGPLKADDPLVRLFGRRARAVMLVPILVGDRFVGVLYGDAGNRAIPPSSLAELHMVVPRLGKGLGNLILRAKKRATTKPTATVTVAEPQSAARSEPVAETPASSSSSSSSSSSKAAAARAETSFDAELDDDLDIPVVVVGQLMEEDIAVAPQAPARDVPAIAIEAPSSISSDPSPPEHVFYAWADGKDDDEDVRLDDIALLALDGMSTSQPPSTRIEMSLAEEASFDELDSSELKSVPDAAPIVSIPDGEMPAPEPPRATHASRDDDVPAVAPSPGAHAREALLAATYQGWIGHEDAALDELVGQLHQRGEKERKAATAAVVGHGLRAMPSLARYFPGVLAVHPFGAMDRRPDVDETSDCLACLVRLGPDLAAPILVGELAHDDRLHRWSAVWALSTLRVPGALPRLAQRVFDPEPAIASLAIEILDGYRDADAFPKVLAQVRDLIRRGDPFEKSRAIAAVGELRDREALSSLVDLLGTRPKEVAEEARRALVEITKQDFGTAERRWRAWIADNEKTPRTRWLIEGLGAKDDDIRKSAQAELNRMTGQFFGYRWDAPRTDRELSLAQWQDWWAAQERDGQRRWP